MRICDGTSPKTLCRAPSSHTEIIIEGDDRCPFGDALEKVQELEDKISDLQTENADLEKEREAAKAEATKFENQIADMETEKL